MPRVTVHLRDVNHAAEVHQQASAAAPGTEKEISSWLIFTVGPQAIVERADVRRVSVWFGVNDGPDRFRTSIVSRRRGNSLESKLSIRRSGVVVINGDPWLRMSYRPKRRQNENHG